jgi:hypothetical protein
VSTHPVPENPQLLVIKQAARDLALDEIDSRRCHVRFGKRLGFELVEELA